MVRNDSIFQLTLDFSFSERTPLRDPSWARYALTAYVDASGVLNAVGGSDSNGKYAQNVIRYDISTYSQISLLINQNIRFSFLQLNSKALPTSTSLVQTFKPL